MAAVYPDVAPFAAEAEAWRVPYVVRAWTMTMLIISAVAGAYLLLVRMIGGPLLFGA